MGVSFARPVGMLKLRINQLMQIFTWKMDVKMGCVCVCGAVTVSNKTGIE